MKNIRNLVPMYQRNNDNSVVSNSGPIPLTWDRDGLLQDGPHEGYIICEKIGKMLFVKVMDTIVANPTGPNAIFYSPTGIIPDEYRPVSNQLTSALVVTGYVNPVVILQATSPRNTPLGACILDVDGTLSFGASLMPNSGPVANDGETLTPFQGPGPCGILKQVLVFSLE